MKENKAIILKGTSVKLDDDTIAIVWLMYHANKQDKTDPSWYRYEGKVYKLEDLKKELSNISPKNFPEVCVKDWIYLPSGDFPSDKFDSWVIEFSKESTMERKYKWFCSRIQNALSWEDYVKLIKDGIKRLNDGREKQNPHARYETEEFVSEDGGKISIANKDDLMRIVGKKFWKNLPLKRQPIIF